MRFHLRNPLGLVNWGTLDFLSADNGVDSAVPGERRRDQGESWEMVLQSPPRNPYGAEADFFAGSGSLEKQVNLSTEHYFFSQTT